MRWFSLSQQHQTKEGFAGYAKMISTIAEDSFQNGSFRKGTDRPSYNISLPSACCPAAQISQLARSAFPIPAPAELGRHILSSCCARFPL